MICPYCKKEMKAEKENGGWYAECLSCGMTIGLKFRKFTLQRLSLGYKGRFKTKKELTRYVNQGGKV